MNFQIDTTPLSCASNLFQIQDFEVLSIPKSYQVSLDKQTNPCVSINATLAENEQNILIIDEKVFSLYGHDIQWPMERVFQVIATEKFKSMEGVLALYDFLHAHHITKGETLVVVGGGITQDISAFVAATYKRGLNWVFFPSTLLAMSDSCIGGKAGVNFKGSKNQLALFSSPQAVILNLGFLNTLEPKELQSGLGEILKLCVTGGQVYLDFFDTVVSFGQVKEIASFKSLIMCALGIKRAVIEEDEFEQSIRKGLNYGHTIGHVFESLTNYEIPHGIAVVLGMLIVNQLSFDRGLLSKVNYDALYTQCLNLVDKKYIDRLAHISSKDIMAGLKQDKKVTGETITFVMLSAPGYLSFVKSFLNENLEKELEKSILIIQSRNE